MPARLQRLRGLILGISAAVAAVAAVAGPAGAATVEAVPLQVLAPATQASGTTREFVNVLGRTRPGMRVTVAGEPVTVYATGVFVRDRVPLAPGLNRIRVEAVDPAPGSPAAEGPRRHTEIVLEVQRLPPPEPAPPPARDRLDLDPASLQPREVLRVEPGEPFEVAVVATPGLRVQARLPDGDWQPLPEDPARPGRYAAALHLGEGPDTEPGPVQLRLLAPRTLALEGPRQRLVDTPGAVGRWSASSWHLATVGAEGADLVHGLHTVRLGGPNLAELAAGTVLRLTGQRGEHYRVRLAPDTHAWVRAASVQRRAEPAARLPHATFTSARVAGAAAGDVVSLAFPAPLPYAVRSLTTPEGRTVLEVDLYGTHLATTWVTHLATARLVREITFEQPADGRVRLRIVPQAPRLWGWRAEQDASGLRITLRAPPPLDGAGASPLAGLVVALEAGHGGPTNLGAVGATGVPEKDINRWTTDALAAELERAGARVVQVREGDDNPTLRERARRVTASEAALFVSVHANAADTSAGYLRAAGTSTYYKHPASRELAGAIQQRLLADTGLPDFGIVGAFNYAPIRLVTSMPAVLVEQAFVSHPGEEALLLDPDFRARMARAVRLGIEDFLRAAAR
jgi:N-acetylmuramoyl-L-alanine amidase